MNLVSFQEPVTLSFRKSAGGSSMTLDAYRDWVFPNAQLDRVMQEENVRERRFKVSKMDMMLRNLNVNEPGKKGKLLVYNGSGGYGDQIMTWPFTRILAEMGYEVHVAIDPGNQMCWWNLPWVTSVMVMPIQAGLFFMFDHHACFDTVCNVMEHPNHPTPLDAMLFKVGIDPMSIDPARKVVKPNFTAAEIASTQVWQDRPFAMYQLCSTNPVRHLPSPDSAYMFLKLCEAFPQWTWIALYDPFVPKEYVHALLEPVMDEKNVPKKNERGEDIMRIKAPNGHLLHQPNLRELWALTAKAQVVVSIDSMMVHVAGSQGVPCVGLWGPYSAMSRVPYYKNHVPVFNANACPHAPCNHYLNVFPTYCPPRPNRNVCECLAAISPAQVITAVRAIKAAVPGVPKS